MSEGDYCAVYGCSNDRRKTDKAIVMDHVGKLRWYPSKHSSWWSALEGVFRVRLQKTCWYRRIYSPQSYIFKTSSTSWSRPIYSSCSYVFKTSCKNVFKTSSRRLQNVFKMSSKNFFKTSLRRLQDIFKTSCKDVFKMFSRFIIKLNFSCKHVFKIYSTRFWDVPQSRLSKEGFATSEKFMVNVKTLQEWWKFLKF